MGKRIGIVFFIMFFLVACQKETEEIVDKESVKNNAILELTAVIDSNLNNDTYYVKNDKYFYQVYMPNYGNVSAETDCIDEARVICLTNDVDMVPNYYKNELIAFQSNNIKFNSVNLERFEDLGYSFGCFNCTLDEDGYLYVNKDINVIKDSSLYSILENTDSTDVRIVSIDGKKISSMQVDIAAGVIKGLEPERIYSIEYYAGTKFCESELYADCKMLKAFELFLLDDENIVDTTEGYMRFNIPSDYKSGYYMINGAGLFRYNSFDDSGIASVKEDYNEVYFSDEQNKMAEYMNKSSLIVDNRDKNKQIYAELDEEGSYDINHIKAYIYSPEGIKYRMTFNEDNNRFELDVLDCLNGEWNLYSYPKSLNIKNLYIYEEDNSDIEIDDENIDVFDYSNIVYEETIIDILKNTKNVKICSEIQNLNEVEECVVWGQVVSEDGSFYNMNYNKENKTIECNLLDVIPQNYNIRIYHDYNESIIGVPVIQEE